MWNQILGRVSHCAAKLTRQRLSDIVLGLAFLATLSVLTR